jgi:hypothetical protein
VTRVFFITRLHFFVSIERPAFNEIPDTQPAAVLNVTARYIPGIGVRQRLARLLSNSTIDKKTRRLIAIMAACALLRLLRGYRSGKTDAPAMNVSELKGEHPWP